MENLDHTRVGVLTGDIVLVLSHDNIRSFVWSRQLAGEESLLGTSNVVEQEVSFLVGVL